MRPLTLNESRFLWTHVRPLLDSEPRVRSALREQAAALAAEGHQPYEVDRRQADLLIEMAEDSEPVAPFDGERSEFARVVRVCAHMIANGTYEPEPEPVDLIGQNAAAFQQFASSSDEAAQMVPTVLPGPRLAVLDTRERS